MNERQIVNSVETLEAAMARVKAAYVSPSIRDTDMNGLHIHTGDTIGIIDKEIVVSDSDRFSATSKLMAMLLDMPEKSMLTVFCGKDAKDDEKEKLQSFVEEKYPSAEVYFADGGQEIYPYILIAE